LEVEESIWKERVRKDASMKGLGLCYRVKERICTKKGEGLLVVKRGKRGDASICRRSVEKGIYSTL